MAIGILEVIAARKTLSFPPTWQAVGEGGIELVAPLELDGITVQGLLLRAKTKRRCPDEDVMLQLEYPHHPGRRDRAVSRIDWRAFHTHNNRGIGPPHLRYVDINGSHWHEFALNWLEDQLRLRADNLPVAQPLDEEPDNFANLLDLAGRLLRIANLEIIPPPPWEGTLL